jgi:hypothetical protein
MVMDQEQRELGRPSGVLAALLPSPNVVTISTDERRMAFVNAAPLARVLAAALPSCHNTRDSGALRTVDSLHDGKLLPPSDRSNTILSCVADAGIPNMFWCHLSLRKISFRDGAAVPLPRSLISHLISL